jgi:hypothetical protein
MKDYKNLFKNKFKKLEKEINKSFRTISRIEIKKEKRGFFISVSKFLFNPISLVICCAAFIICILALSFSAFISGNRHSYDSSYLGMTKIQEELDSMVNINASGGNEIKINDTNNNELKFFFYKIKQGESLYTISKKLGVSMDTLISLNSIENAQNLKDNNSKPPGNNLLCKKGRHP